MPPGMMALEDVGGNIFSLSQARTYPSLGPGPAPAGLFLAPELAPDGTGPKRMKPHERLGRGAKNSGKPDVWV